MTAYTALADQFEATSAEHRAALRAVRYGRCGASAAAAEAAERLSKLLPKLLTAAMGEGFKPGTDADAAALALIIPGPVDPARVWSAWATLSGRWRELAVRGIPVAAYRGDLSALPPFPPRVPVSSRRVVMDPATTPPTPS